MKTSSLYEELTYEENKPAIKVMLETSFTKEIRIALKGGQIMKEHKTSFPIVVQIIEGKLDFGVNGKVLNLQKGDLLALEASVPHDLKAIDDCIVRLTLTKSDEANRVRYVIDN